MILLINDANNWDFVQSVKKSAPKSPEAESFEEKSPDEDAQKKVEVVKPKAPVKQDISLEELKKKQAKSKDENPKITKFKTAEVKLVQF